ncbi:MAG TPA: methionine aminotransferase [Sphingobacteriaceae bacterium]
MLSLISKLPHVGNSIFSVMSQLAQEAGAINLSQGFPDYDCPPELIDHVHRHMKAGHNQYAPMPGIPKLRQLIAEKVNSRHGSSYDADTEITVTSGGTQAIFTALAAVIQPNDEVIIFEPAYDCYAPTVRLLGGLVKPFELTPPDYKTDWAMVKRLVTAHTKMIIINSPHNPTGTILAEDDIQELISITKNTDILVLSDEVYEHLSYDGAEHLSMARFPELQKRSFITASFGKLFHNTGWKMGYCIAPAQLMAEFRKVHQFMVFSANTPVQHALADALADKDYYAQLNGFFQEKRDFFTGLLNQTKFQLLPCSGSYFQCVTYKDISEEKDTDFAKRLIYDFGVASIPVSAFYTKNTDFGVLRFCFAKKNETLEAAAEQLMKI